MTYFPSGSTPSSKRSTDTPSQTVSNLLHLVTQWISTVTVSVGSVRNSAQFQRCGDLMSPVTARSHFSSGVCGVGPAESTGKSVVRYCPGGNRPARAGSSCRRPRNPREMNLPTIDASGNLTYRNACAYPQVAGPFVLLSHHHITLAVCTEGWHRPCETSLNNSTLP